MEVRIRLDTRTARFAPSPMLSLELPDGATVDELYDRFAQPHPELAPALALGLARTGRCARRARAAAYERR